MLRKYHITTSPSTAHTSFYRFTATLITGIWFHNTQKSLKARVPLRPTDDSRRDPNPGQSGFPRPLPAVLPRKRHGDVPFMLCTWE